MGDQSTTVDAFLKSGDLKEAFNNYLEKMGLAKGQLDSIQYRELKRAFYGGVSSLLLITLNLPEGDEESFKVIDSIETQCQIFWESEVSNG
ncbi:hypothetical protein [Roseivirga thermotolerans]|uniref:Uncharacterized protein n=1 Tax=Roseivirga thermotolerans TaxID=1758176 RepID=A0ABQ3I7Q8_9BACT|nr:hypothetical protein [Roseivirga thermotolerans]GHE65098.1 hypothetical protein GCM10011340_20180 [Roseivirga thermotolerans]